MLLALNNNMKGFDLVLNTTKKHENKDDNDKKTTEQVDTEETTKNTKRDEASQPTITTLEKTRQTEEKTQTAQQTMRASPTTPPYPNTYTRQSTTTADKALKHLNSTQMATSTFPSPMANMQIEAKTEDIGVLNIILILISIILAIFSYFLLSSSTRLTRGN